MSPLGETNKGLTNMLFLPIVLGALADPGKARGCSTNTVVIHSFIKSVLKWWIFFTGIWPVLAMLRNLHHVP